MLSTSPSPPKMVTAHIRVMLNTLKDAKIQPQQVQYINAHGTSTDIGDKLETVAIKRAFGDHAYKLAVSSTKSMTGHLAGRRRRPGSWNYPAGAAGPDFAAHHQPGKPRSRLRPGLRAQPSRKAQVEYAMSNSFGFGGTNGALLFRHWSE